MGISGDATNHDLFAYIYELTCYFASASSAALEASLRTKIRALRLGIKCILDAPCLYINLFVHNFSPYIVTVRVFKIPRTRHGDNHWLKSFLTTRSDECEKE